MSENIMEIGTKEFDKNVIKGKGLILVDFWAPWCGPCLIVSPVLEEIAREMADSITIYKVNVDNNRDLAVTYGISGIPTFILFKEGEIVSQHVGVIPKAGIVNIIQSNL
jgi:thioredoxin 1